MDGLLNLDGNSLAILIAKMDKTQMVKFLASNKELGKTVNWDIVYNLMKSDKYVLQAIQFMKNTDVEAVIYSCQGQRHTFINQISHLLKSTDFPPSLNFLYILHNYLRKNHSSFYQKTFSQQLKRHVKKHKIGWTNVATFGNVHQEIRDSIPKIVALLGDKFLEAVQGQFQGGTMTIKISIKEY